MADQDPPLGYQASHGHPWDDCSPIIRESNHVAAEMVRVFDRVLGKDHVTNQDVIRQVFSRFAIPDSRYEDLETLLVQWIGAFAVMMGTQAVAGLVLQLFLTAVMIERKGMLRDATHDTRG